MEKNTAFPNGAAMHHRFRSNAFSFTAAQNMTALRLAIGADSVTHSNCLKTYIFETVKTK